MTPSELRAALEEGERNGGIKDLEVHNFAMHIWRRDVAIIPEEVYERHRWAEGIVNEWIADDEELMFQWAVFKMPG